MLLDISKKSFASSEATFVQSTCFSLKEIEVINRFKLDLTSGNIKTNNSGCSKV